MKINRGGVTRLVIEFDRVVVKIPNFTYSWYNFIQGLLGNMNEKRNWSYTNNPLLCPILWVSWGGWILVMEKALIFEEEDAELDYSPWRECGLGGDDKPTNYGVLRGRMVKVDYASI